MSNKRPDPGPRSIVTLLLGLVGVLLLLPGLCAVIFAADVIAKGEFIRLVTRDPFFQIVLMVWSISLAVSLGGLFLIRHALRRHRGHAP
jgi:hypothetical protein